MKIEKFWKRVVKTDSCWIWTGAKHQDGYGYLWFKGHQVLTHRYSWFMKFGVMPEKQVNHNCDNRPCVNPDHLYEGTQTQNIKDMDARGRRGRTTGMGKLDEVQIREIRKLISEGMRQESIGARFEVTQAAISSIHRGKTWRHVA